MKRTDQERIERELKRREKKVRVAERRDGKKSSPGAFIQDLFGLLEFDEHQIYNTLEDEDILELLLMMKQELPEKQWDSVIKGAIRKTKVAEKDMAFSELKSLLD